MPIVPQWFVYEQIIAQWSAATTQTARAHTCLCWICPFTVLRLSEAVVQFEPLFLCKTLARWVEGITAMKPTSWPLNLNTLPWSCKNHMGKRLVMVIITPPPAKSANRSTTSKVLAWSLSMGTIWMGAAPSNPHRHFSHLCSSRPIMLCLQPCISVMLFVQCVRLVSCARPQGGVKWRWADKEPILTDKELC